MDVEQLGFILTAVLVGSVLVCFVIGGEYNRRRAARLGLWVYQGLRLFPGRASVRWLTTHAFEVFVDDPPRPFSVLRVTALLESRDMLAVWLYNRLSYRPDLLVLRANLQRKPIWGCEVFRPRTILSGDARYEAEAESWTLAPVTERGLQAWHGGGRGAELCSRLLASLAGIVHEPIRVAVHRREPHLVLAVSAARFDGQEPRSLFEAFRRLAEITSEYATPGAGDQEGARQAPG